MKVLITGASGLIGSALCKALVADGHVVMALSRNVKVTQQAFKRRFGDKLVSSVEWVSDLLEIGDLNDVDAVVNLAGEPIVGKRWSRQQKNLIENSRWLITKQLSDLINKSNSPPEVFISGSAIGYYGRQNAQPQSEFCEHPYPEFSHHLCKRWEEIATQAQSEKTRVCLIRTGIVLSDKGGALSNMLLPFKLGLGGKIASGKQGMSWIHIEDMIQGIQFLLSHPTCQGVFNFTAPNPVDNEAFSKALASRLSRPCLFPMPEFALRILMGEVADLLVYGQFVIPSNLLEAGFEFQYPELTRALKALTL